MQDKFWQFVRNEAGEVELLLEGVIAQTSWWGDEVTPKAFKKELKQHQGSDITVRINSPGGDVFAGVSIYNALLEHDGKVTVKVDALAASAASFVAMAGEEIIMLPGSMMMIHNPWTLAMGNKDELAKVVEMLEKTGDSIASIYVARTGKTEEEIADLLAAETWMTAEEAVEMGFATEAQEAKKPSVSDSIKNALSYASTVRNAVIAPAMSIKAKTEAKEVEEINDSNTAKKPAANATEESKTPDANKADKPDSPEKKVIKQTKTVEPADKTVEDNKANPAEKEIEMTEQDKLAAAQVLEPSKQPNPSDTPTVTLKDYLKTNEAMETFASILQANPSDMGNGGSAVVRNAWKEHLEVKAGVTNPEIFLPTPLVEAIQNAFEDGGKIWNAVAKVGADVWNAAWDSEDDVNSNDGRARGYNRADQAEKAEQVLTFDDRVLRPQFVYKYITLNKEDIKEQRSTGALVTYILAELPQRIVREVERAIVLGDGRASDDDYKIKAGDPRGFYPLLADALAGGYFGDVVEVSGDASLAEGVARAKDAVKTGGAVFLIAKSGFSTDARFEKDADGRLLFPLGSKASDVFDIPAENIIEPDWFTDTSSPTVDALVVVLSAYKVVGDTTVEGFQNFILKTNKQEYLQEIWAGGGLTGRKAVIGVQLGS